MENIHVKVRLRPIRFAFLLRPDDKVSLQKVFQINTCLWGGIYNPIVPFFKRVPSWWKREDFGIDNAAQILNGYLDFFEPDYVVETEKGISHGFGIDPARVLQLAEILPNTDSLKEKGYGLSVFDIYRKLYHDKFQFIHRHKHDIVSIEAENSAYKNFASCVFGTFPRQNSLKYFGNAFTEAFEPIIVSINGSTLSKIYESEYSSALLIGKHGLNVQFNNYADPVLFILDVNEPKDLIDFWNYRAIKQNVLAIPLQWIDKLSDFCKSYIIKNFHPHSDNSHLAQVRVTCLFSRSIPSNDIYNIHKSYLQVDIPGANVIQTWYPSIWRSPNNSSDPTSRPIIIAEEKKYIIPVDIENPLISIDLLHPKFTSHFGAMPQWANVIQLEGWSLNDQIATIFPTNYKQFAVPKLNKDGDKLVSTNEGLISFPRFRDISQRWLLVEGKEAFKQWLERDKIVTNISEAGRAAHQIIQTLGGFGGVRCISHKGVINLLAEMARKPITKCLHQAEFKQKIKDAVRDNTWRDISFETLVERKAVILGYELKCSKCGSKNWYALNQFSSLMTCELCLREFNFPATNPSNRDARWAYRVAGPFALPDYAKGGYASALAIRFLDDLVKISSSSKITWSAGQELTFPNGEKIEVDFLIWYQRKKSFRLNHPTEIIFGEAKSFGKDSFKDEDVKRLMLLAEKYPCSFIIFATLKEFDQLSKDEITRIKRLAEWGRKYDKNMQKSRAPVILLTGTELLTPYYFEQAWEQKGGKHRQLISQNLNGFDNLRILADLTQQLYLEMPSYSLWRQTYWDNKNKLAMQKPKS